MPMEWPNYTFEERNSRVTTTIYDNFANFYSNTDELITDVYLVTELGVYIITEEGIFLLTEINTDPPVILDEQLLTEDGNGFLTESFDSLLFEVFAALFITEAGDYLLTETSDTLILE